MITENLKEHLLHSPASKQWEKIPVENHHGIDVPLFSLRSKQSAGIGEYTDLIPLIDWCKSINMDVIQLLPLNDTSEDSSPYNNISAFALNPIHLGLAELPNIDSQGLQAILKALQAILTPTVDYVQVRNLKEVFLDQYFEVEFENASKTKGYQKFVEQNPWLVGYALFKALKKKNGRHPWEAWPIEEREPTKEKLEEFTHTYAREIVFHSFVQYLCYQQMTKVKEYATSKGVFLKGDIPILISRDSAEVWLHRSLFKMEYTAGSPPDVFTQEGQNWGFPIYNWDELQITNHSWWRMRLKTAEQFYHIYRIDHIIGFFRIWAIPIGKKATEGKFVPEDQQKWIPQGKAILEMMLAETTLLPIGEDLGVVSNETRKCMRDLGICGTKVMRWERYWHGDRGFIQIENYDPVSMTTVSTHDSETLQQWWSDYPEEAREFAKTKGWNYEPFLSHDYRSAILYDSHHSSSLFHINLLQEYLALFPDLVSSNPNEERINLPGTISDRNWSYRYRPSIEEIVNHQELAQKIREIIK